jgi:hypothetical protein
LIRTTEIKTNKKTSTAKSTTTTHVTIGKVNLQENVSAGAIRSVCSYAQTNNCDDFISKTCIQTAKHALKLYRRLPTFALISFSYKGNSNSVQYSTEHNYLNIAKSIRKARKSRHCINTFIIDKHFNEFF